MDDGIRPATPADLDACARLAAEHDGRYAATHRERLRAQLDDAERAGEVVGSARVSRFTPRPDNVAPAGWYLIGLVTSPVRATRRRSPCMPARASRSSRA